MIALYCNYYRSELRSKILACRGNQEKQRLEEEFQNVEQKADNMEQEVIKLQLLAQEVCVFVCVCVCAYFTLIIYK